MRRIGMAITLFLLMTGSSRAEPPAQPDGSAESSGHGSPSAAVQVEPAPGGGEMIILGPEFQYVIRGRAEAGTKVRGTCAHDGRAAAAAEAMRK